jgi:hypothetical protein
MTHTIDIFFGDIYSIWGVLIFGAVGFVLGLLVRLAINAKQKRKVLKLEDEMLRNHSRILSLEEKISVIEKENYELSNNMPKKAQLKVS